MSDSPHKGTEEKITSKFYKNERQQRGKKQCREGTSKLDNGPSGHFTGAKSGRGRVDCGIKKKERDA